jgi:hypothetical protein
MAKRGRKQIKKAVGNLLSVKQDKVRYVPALMGAYVNGQKTIEVSGRPDFVWCRLRGGTSEVIQAFNDKVGHHWDLPILVFRDPEAPDRWRVHGRDIRAYEDWEGVSYIVPHADSHSFAGGEKTGADIVWTFKRQYMPMLPRPVASGTMSIYIEPDFYYFEGGFHWWPGSGSADLSAYRPTGGYNARYVTVYIDGNTGNPAVLAGDEFSMVLPPGDPGSYIAIPTPDQGVPIAAVALQTGTRRIGWGEIYDLRNPNRPADVTGSYISIYDEGVYLGVAAGINIVGEKVETVISGTIAHIIHTGTASEATYLRAGAAIPLATPTGGYWKVPDGVFATGTLSIMLNGVWQRPIEDYQSQYPQSGTFEVYDQTPTGSQISAIWGVPGA